MDEYEWNKLRMYDPEAYQALLDRMRKQQQELQDSLSDYYDSVREDQRLRDED